MVTIYPAQLAKLDDKIGSLQPQHVADILVIKSSETDPYRALLNAKPAEVALVIIGGIPVYGDEELMHIVASTAQFEPMRLCDVERVINFDSETVSQGKPPKSWDETVHALAEALKPFHLTLSESAPCANK